MAFCPTTSPLYRHSDDPQEWENLAGDKRHAAQMKKLAAWVPKTEAPLVLSGKALHSVADADQPSLENIQEFWNEINAQIDPKLE